MVGHQIFFRRDLGEVGGVHEEHGTGRRHVVRLQRSQRGESLRMADRATGCSRQRVDARGVVPTQSNHQSAHGVGQSVQRHRQQRSRYRGVLIFCQIGRLSVESQHQQTCTHQQQHAAPRQGVRHVTPNQVAKQHSGQQPHVTKWCHDTHVSDACGLDQKEIARGMQSLQKKKLLQEKEVAKAQRRQIRKQKWENFIKPFKATWRVVFSILKTIYWVVVFLLMVIQEIWEILTYFFKPRKYK